MAEHTEKVNLGGCSEITLRTRARDDMDLVFDFYQNLTDSEKDMAQIDIRNKEDVIRRFDELEDQGAERIIAICNDTKQVIGEAILENMRYGWMRKTASVRILLHPDFMNKNLAEQLVREVFLLAAKRGMNHIIFKLMDGEEEMFEILKELHFNHEATQKKHIVDASGQTKDVLLMTFSLRKMWQAMEESFRAVDDFSREY